MADNPAYGRRLREAKRSYELACDCDLTWREIGERVGKALKREPIKAQVVQRWFVAGREPTSFAVTEAIGAVLNADPSWLAFGTGAMQPREGSSEAPPASATNSLPAAAQAVLDQYPPRHAPATAPRTKRKA